ncbi:copper amine oxidase N-terminal domain-containing protein [Paenibacillus sp. HN-1]|uniref:copper amine oxidase N-terminal domain-containing protein n=1 Tax=Paenibacillus TaxID=44249 RepID=UPI001CA9B739|nr:MULTISPECIES: copper amine oxidase N-terminal domain-containing protein [Paenibacillus]MBY9078892.1 copper amine oxidase N-terminal domain-containing protein [Paenibacillus sp. CGMCC 1.18879]MBY9082878.1 copper amine oxidase N-terminal domain-containing protein [Paenibacillus sinensis]
MKKWCASLGAILLSLVLAVPVFAAQTPIKVYVDGAQVSFPAGSPYILNSSVMVPFRAVFESLGLTVGWDPAAKSVTGTSDGLAIKLTVGSNRASVNNVISKLLAAPVQNGGTVYVPLRFIGEATGGDVKWDPAARSVQISKPSASNGISEADLTAVINKLNGYYNTEDVAGIKSLAADGSSFASSLTALDSTFKYYDLKYELKSLSVISATASDATVSTVEINTRTGGYYLPDSQDEIIYYLVNTDGSWKVSKITTEKSTVLLTREQGIAKANVPVSDQAAIHTLLTNHYQNMNTENVAGVMSTLTSYDDEDYTAGLKSSLEKFFQQSDLSYFVNSSNIFYYGDDEAAVYVELQATDKSDSSTADQTLILVVDKYNGKWTISDSYTVSP